MSFRMLIICFVIAFAQGAFAAGTNRIFVTNEGSDNLSVINGRTLEVEATIPIGERPRGIGFAPDHTELYIAVSEEDAIAVVDPASLKVLRKFPAGSDPETFAVHPNGHIYLSNEDAGLASAFDPKTGAKVAEVQVGLEPEGVAVSHDGKTVVVTSESTNMLHFIAVPEHQIVQNVLVGARPRSAVFSSDDKLVYASAEIAGEVSKISTETFKPLATVRFDDDKAKPMEVMLSHDEKSLYVAGGRANEVLVIDTESMQVTKKIPVGKRVWGLARTRDGSRVFSTDGASNAVSVIDTATNEVIKQVPVGELPWGVVVDD
jgi:PQQ-dependent catabolism-associated beta-propeller protein